MKSKLRLSERSFYSESIFTTGIINGQTSVRVAQPTVSWDVKIPANDWMMIWTAFVAKSRRQDIAPIRFLGKVPARTIDWPSKSPISKPTSASAAAGRVGGSVHSETLKGGESFEIEMVRWTFVLGPDLSVLEWFPLVHDFRGPPSLSGDAECDVATSCLKPWMEWRKSTR